MTVGEVLDTLARWPREARAVILDPEIGRELDVELIRGWEKDVPLDELGSLEDLPEHRRSEAVVVQLSGF